MTRITPNRFNRNVDQRRGVTANVPGRSLGSFVNPLQQRATVAPPSMGRNAR